MKGGHIFIANGDSCPICSAMHGQFVTAGYKPHANCSCQTISPRDGDDFTFDVTEESAGWSGGQFKLNLKIEVTCPDGTTHESSEITIPISELFSKDGIREIEDLAREDCQDCEGNEFLCC